MIETSNIALQLDDIQSGVLRPHSQFTVSRLWDCLRNRSTASRGSFAKE
jgi:hypothetical protein